MRADQSTGQISLLTGRKGLLEGRGPSSWNLQTVTVILMLTLKKTSTHLVKLINKDKSADLGEERVGSALPSGGTGCCSEGCCWGALLDLPPGCLCVQLQGKALYSSVS